MIVLLNKDFGWDEPDVGFLRNCSDNCVGHCLYGRAICFDMLLRCIDAAKVKRALQMQQEGLTTIAALDSGSAASLYRPG